MSLKIKGSIGAAIIVGAMTISVGGQTPSSSPTPETTIKLSRILEARLNVPVGAVSQENSALAFRKLLEGERHLWKVKNTRGRRNASTQQQNIRDARLAFQDAIAANPRLAEAYTALAELAITAPPTDVDEAIALAELSLRINKENFGARRILARLYTFKSGLGTRALDAESSAKAVTQWKFIASLDPRYMEAWAFLAEFYEHQNNQNELIAALENWRSSASAIDTQFYRQMTGGRETLSPETATLKLGEALLKAGRTEQAMNILGEVIADEPDNSNAVQLLRTALVTSKPAVAEKAVPGLRQALFARPDNVAILNLLAEAYARSGRDAEAATILEDAANKVAGKDTVIAGMHFVSLGEIFERVGKYDEARKNYDRAIAVRRLEQDPELSEGEKVFLESVYERLTRLAKSTGRTQDVLAVIQRATRTLGPASSFADRELVSHYRETGKRAEALNLISTQRKTKPLDEGLARQEATLLTELGRVDEAVAGYRKFMATRLAEAANASVPAIPLDNFSSLLFITSLYSQANRGKEAVEAANQALAAAKGSERRQIARLSIATAMQMSGDQAGAENTLRDILRESPNNPIALNNLGYFLLERNERFDEAVSLIRQAVDIDPTNPSYLDSLGWAYFKLGKLAEAELYLKEALRYDPSSATINDHLGDVYAAQSKPEQARIYWKRSLTLASEGKDIDRLSKKLGVR